MNRHKFTFYLLTQWQNHLDPQHIKETQLRGMAGKVKKQFPTSTVSTIETLRGGHSRYTHYIYAQITIDDTKKEEILKFVQSKDFTIDSKTVYCEKLPSYIR